MQAIPTRRPFPSAWRVVKHTEENTASLRKGLRTQTEETKKIKWSTTKRGDKTCQQLRRAWIKTSTPYILNRFLKVQKESTFKIHWIYKYSLQKSCPLLLTRLKTNSPRYFWHYQHVTKSNLKLQLWHKRGKHGVFSFRSDWYAYKLCSCKWRRIPT